MTIKQPSGLVTGLPNCGVVAVATALDLPYQNVWDYFASTRPHQWRGRLYWVDLRKAIKHFGGKVKPHTTKMTLAKWVDMHTVSGRTYIVRLGGHFVTVKDSFVVDQTATAPVTDHWARNKRVTHSMEIIT